MTADVPRIDPADDVHTSIRSPTLIAYLVAATVALIAFELPVAVVTAFEGASTADSSVQPFPQWLVLVGLAIAAGGGRLRHAWPAAFTLGLLLVVGGGLFGASGGEMLIDMEDSDASGEIRSGAVAVPVAAALAVGATVVDCRGHLGRINPGRPRVWAWAAAVVAVPLAATVVPVAVVLARGGGSVLGLVVIAPVLGGAVGGLLVRRWATRPGEL